MDETLAEDTVSKQNRRHLAEHAEAEVQLQTSEEIMGDEGGWELAQIAEGQTVFGDV